MYNFVFIVILLKTPYKFCIIQPYGRYCVNSQHNILIKLYALLTTFFCLTLRHHGKLFSASVIFVYAGSTVLYINGANKQKWNVCFFVARINYDSTKCRPKPNLYEKAREVFSSF